eukprot:234405-Chlamydomonas_euryale.AAC.4
MRGRGCAAAGVRSGWYGAVEEIGSVNRVAQRLVWSGGGKWEWGKVCAAAGMDQWREVGVWTGYSAFPPILNEQGLTLLDPGQTQHKHTHLQP